MEEQEPDDSLAARKCHRHYFATASTIREHHVKEQFPWRVFMRVHGMSFLDGSLSDLQGKNPSSREEHSPAATRKCSSATLTISVRPMSKEHIDPSDADQ